MIIENVNITQMFLFKCISLLWIDECQKKYILDGIQNILRLVQYLSAYLINGINYLNSNKQYENMEKIYDLNKVK